MDDEPVMWEITEYEVTPVPPDSTAFVEDTVLDAIKDAVYAAGLQDAWDNRQIKVKKIEKGIPVGAPVVIAVVIAVGVGVEGFHAIKNVLDEKYNTRQRGTSRSTRDPDDSDDPNDLEDQEGE